MSKIKKNIFTIKIVPRKSRKKIKEDLWYYEDKIRDYTNNTINQYKLMGDSEKWNQLCSSLDVIGDTGLAILTFQKSKFGITRRTNHLTKSGIFYIIAYGVMQALILQQDAVNHLCEVLRIDESTFKYENLLEIRENRNDSGGHPTKRNNRKSKELSYHYISRITLSKSGFQLLSFKKGNHFFKEVSLSKMISIQNKQVLEIMKKIKRELERREKEHKIKFKGEKLHEILAKNLSYNFEKIYEAIQPITEVVYKTQMALWGVDSLNDKLQKFRNVLIKRGLDIDAYDSIKFIFKEVEYPIKELKKYFEFYKSFSPNDKIEVINNETAGIFVYYLDKKFEELCEMAKEIDEEYEKF